MKSLFKSLNIQFILYFLLFSYIPLLIFSVLGYFLNRHLIAEIHETNTCEMNRVISNRIADFFEFQKQFAEYRLERFQNQENVAEIFLFVDGMGKVIENRISVKLRQQLIESLERPAYNLIITPELQLFHKIAIGKNEYVFLPVDIKKIQSFIRTDGQSEKLNILVSQAGNFFITPAKTGFLKNDGITDYNHKINQPEAFELSSFSLMCKTAVNQDLILLSGSTTTGIYSELHSFLVEIIIANLFIGILIFFIAIFFSRRITNPIQSLITAVQNISHGDMSQPIEIKSNDEIELLAGEFEQMRQRLRESYTDLETKIEERTQALRDAQFQISHQEKMASLGLLAAGVAHEIGNPLTSISSMAQIIKRKVKDQNFVEYLNTILKNIDRIRKIVRELVDFARPSSYEASETDINELIRNAVGIVKYDRRAKSINIDLELDNNLPALYLVADQLMQVFINILINAVDALTEERNRIVIRSFRQGNEIVLQFEDSGIGIERDNLTKIFEPFFTTKQVGKGTGLGLSVSYGIIKNLNGKIEVDSQPGKGSTFTITLPRTTRRT